MSAERVIAAQRGSARIPVIDPDRLDELMRITPSLDRNGFLEYRPCAVETLDGVTTDRVFVVDALSFVMTTGLWPDKVDRWKAVPLAQVAHIKESPSRLPAELANRLYKNGETAMDGVDFTITLSDGRRLGCKTGTLGLDFLEYPDGASAADVVDVKWGRFQGGTDCRRAEVSWCLYCFAPGSPQEHAQLERLARHGMIPTRDQARVGRGGDRRIWVDGQEL
jgi:hypothetical protein